MSTLVLTATTFVVCFASGFVPIINTELYLLSVSTQVSRPALVPLALAAAAGAMTAKALMFLGGRGVARLPGAARSERLARWQAKAAEWKSKPDLVVFLSSTIGIPPLIVVSAFAGALELKLRRFLVIGFAGRLARFATFLAFPHAVLSHFAG